MMYLANNIWRIVVIWQYPRYATGTCFVAPTDFKAPEAQKQENRTVPVRAQTEHKPAHLRGRVRRWAEEQLVLP